MSLRKKDVNFESLDSDFEENDFIEDDCMDEEDEDYEDYEEKFIYKKKKKS